MISQEEYDRMKWKRDLHYQIHTCLIEPGKLLHETGVERWTTESLADILNVLSWARLAYEAYQCDDPSRCAEHVNRAQESIKQMLSEYPGLDWPDYLSKQRNQG
jgi:hypothetical protein